MLKTRIITVLCILPILLLAMFTFPPGAWAAFTLVIVLLACWEWSRFCGFSPVAAKIYVAASALVGGAILTAPRSLSLIEFQALESSLFIISIFFWVIIAPIWLAKLWRPALPGVIGMIGWVVIFPTWLAFLVLREMSPWALLSFAVIVWVADIAAYFAGKKFGKHKLAPVISPGKTVEGVIGGLVGVILYFALWSFLASNSNEVWLATMRREVWHTLILFLLLAVLSVVGDLFESWMKRGAGLKDSSNLLPGHGGILDRIDALTSTLPLAALYMLWANMNALQS